MIIGIEFGMRSAYWFSYYLVDVKRPKRERGRIYREISRRNKIAFYHFLRENDRVKLCKEMFLNTR